MEQVVVPTFGNFILQAAVLLSYLPVTFIAYRYLREQRKRSRAEWELQQVAEVGSAEYQEALRSAHYSLRHYLVPLIYIYVVLLALYGMTHPYVIGRGLWKGLLEDTVTIVTIPEGMAGLAADVIYGRFLFWAWLGAYLHSVERTVRHYVADDLYPDIYVSTAKRFIVAFMIGAIVAVAFGILGSVTPVQIDLNRHLAAVYVVAFVTGLFPERGMRWIVTTGSRLLHFREDLGEEKKLTQIEGLSFWQRDRLDQEGVENAQNLATAHLLTLVARTPYSVGQVVDWVDQATLLVYTSADQFARLKQIGLIRASSVLQTAAANITELASTSGLPVEQLRLLEQMLGTSANIRAICRYRGLSLLGAPAPAAEPEPAAETEPVLPVADVAVQPA
jgi:hypothetical protein